MKTQAGILTNSIKTPNMTNQNASLIVFALRMPERIFNKIVSSTTKTIHFFLYALNIVGKKDESIYKPVNYAFLFFLFVASKELVKYTMPGLFSNLAAWNATHLIAAVPGFFIVGSPKCEVQEKLRNAAFLTSSLVGSASAVVCCILSSPITNYIIPGTSGSLVNTALAALPVAYMMSEVMCASERYALECLKLSVSSCCSFEKTNPILSKIVNISKSTFQNQITDISKNTPQDKTSHSCCHTKTTSPDTFSSNQTIGKYTEKLIESRRANIDQKKHFVIS